MRQRLLFWETLSKTLKFYRSITILISIRRFILVMLVGVFVCLALLEAVGLVMFSVLLSTVYQAIQKDSKDITPITIVNYQVDSIDILFLTASVLVLRSFSTLYLNKRIYDYFSHRLQRISEDNYRRFIYLDLRNQDRIGSERAYALMSFGTNSLIFGTALGTLGLISDAIFTLFILATVLWVSDTTTILIVCAIIAISVLLVLRNRKLMSQLGLDASESMENLALIAKETWALRRELKVIGDLEYFTKQFQGARHKSASAISGINVVGVVLRTKMEIVGLASILFAAGVFLLSDNKSESFVSLGILVLAVTRLIPTLLRVQNAVNNIIANQAYSMNLVDDMIEMMQSEESIQKNNNKILITKNRERQDEEESTLIQVEDVEYSYNSKKKALYDCSLEFYTSEVVLIIGKSGSGKSTLLDLIAGSTQPTTGIVRRAANLKFSYVPQDVALVKGSILENILLGRKLDTQMKDTLKDMISLNGILSFVAGMPNGIETVVGTNFRGLSGGQRQLLGLARAMIQPTDVVLFDEPTNSLDHASIKKFCDLIYYLAKSGTCCLVATHNDKLRSSATRVIHISKGVAQIQPKEEI